MIQQDHSTLKEWTLELKTIDSALETAANRILENCELLVEKAGASSEVQEIVSAIMENCSFHDLNSQRLRKIIKELGLLMNEEGEGLTESEPALASGPQRPGVALTQKDVETLLKN